MEDLCVCVCVMCVLSGCQAELTVVLFLPACCVTQMVVYLSHKLCLCSREDVKMEPDIPLRAN